MAKIRQKPHYFLILLLMFLASSCAPSGEPIWRDSGVQENENKYEYQNKEIAEFSQEIIETIGEKVKPALINIKIDDINSAIRWESFAKINENSTAEDLKKFLIENAETLDKTDDLSPVSIGDNDYCVEIIHHKSHQAFDWGDQPKCDMSIREQMIASGMTPSHVHLRIYLPWNSSCDFEDYSKLIANFHFYKNQKNGCWGGFEGKSESLEKGGKLNICISSDWTDEMGICSHDNLKKLAQDMFAIWAPQVIAYYGIDFDEILNYLANPGSAGLSWGEMALVGLAIILLAVLAAIGVSEIAAGIAVFLDSLIVMFGGKAIIVGFLTTLLILPTVSAVGPAKDFVETDCWDICYNEGETMCFGNEIIQCKNNGVCPTWHEIEKCLGSEICQENQQAECVCQPQCQGKACGPDGCNGTCGTCPAGQICQNGQCIIDIKCGDNKCNKENGETCANCEKDCGKCPASCGNNKCEIGENPCNCKSDCSGCCSESECVDCGLCKAKTCINYACGCKPTPASCCGNNTCEAGESYCNCSNDCSIKCGDGCCSFGESYCNCAADCFIKCGDGCCSSPENCSSCGTDCKCTANQICYNNSCCAPKCSGKQCDDDSCGGNCGTCQLGYDCKNYQCVKKYNSCVNKGCENNDIYCYDSNGQKSLFEDCGDSYVEYGSLKCNNNDDVIKDKTTVSKDCFNSACHSDFSTVPEFVEDCACGCTNGKCDSCYDPCESLGCYNNNVYCYDSDGNKTDLLEDCGDDKISYGSPYCKNGNVVKDKMTTIKGCSNGSCYVDTTTTQELITDCKGCGCSGSSCKSCCQSECDKVGQTECLDPQTLATCYDNGGGCLSWSKKSCICYYYDDPLLGTKAKCCSKPKTCQDLYPKCGYFLSDGCGKFINCPNCSGGEVCCVDECSPICL